LDLSTTIENAPRPVFLARAIALTYESPPPLYWC